MDSSETMEINHEKWLNKIREVVATVINSEEERVPSFTSLKLHWLRSCWVSMLWAHATMENVYSTLPNPTTYGWMINDEGNYEIKWDNENEMQKVKQMLTFLTEGCKCKKGCRSRSCGCRRRDMECGPACKCRDCTNNVGIQRTELVQPSREEQMKSSEHLEPSEEPLEQSEDTSDEKSETCMSGTSDLSDSKLVVSDVEIEEVNILEYGEIKDADTWDL